MQASTHGWWKTVVLKLLNCITLSVMQASTQGWWTTYAEQRGINPTALPDMNPTRVLPSAPNASQAAYPTVEPPVPAQPSAVHRPARTAYGVPPSEVYGDWAPTEEPPEGEEGGWGDVEEETTLQQSLVGRIQGMLMGLVSMLPQLPAAPSPGASDQATLAAAAAEQDAARQDVQVRRLAHTKRATR